MVGEFRGEELIEQSSQQCNLEHGFRTAVADFCSMAATMLSPFQNVRLYKQLVSAVLALKSTSPFIATVVILRILSQRV
jgi:hypothetical protein